MPGTDVLSFEGALKIVHGKTGGMPDLDEGRLLARFMNECKKIAGKTSMTGIDETVSYPAVS